MTGKYLEGRVAWVTGGAADINYAIPNVYVDHHPVDIPVPVGAFRSVAHTATGFVNESFIDELAHAAGADPYQFRRELMKNINPRLTAVMDAVAKRIGWGQARKGRGQGIAALQILNILEGYDIQGMGFGSAKYIHLFVEAKKLAFEDRARVYAVADNEKAVRERLEEFIDDDQVISYILQAIKKQTDDGESGPETEGGGRTPGGNEGGGRRTGDEPSIMGGRPGVTSIGGGRRRTGERPGRGGGSKSDEGNRRTAGQTEDAEASDVATLPADGKIARMLQTAVVDDPRSADPESPADGIDSPDKTGRDDQGIKDAGSAGEAAPGEDQVRDQDKTGTEQGAGMTTPASLLRGEDGQVGTSPVDYDHLPILLDHLTFIDPTSPELPGLIDVNTAPVPVLRTLAALSEEQIQDIIDTRLELDSERKITPAWLITDAGIDLETFEQIAGRICARGNRFTIESLGYSDHRGMMTRLQVVVEMRGPVAQVMYYRDNTHLGTNFPIWYEDGDSTRAERTR